MHHWYAPTLLHVAILEHMFDQGWHNPQQFPALRCSNAPALLARNAERACLLEVFGDEFGASTAR